MVQTRRQENAQKMDARMHNVEQRLQNVDELQETVLGFCDEIWNLGRVFRQELQIMAQEICNIDNRAFRGAVDELCECVHGVATMTQNIAERLDFTHLRQTGTLAEFNVRFNTITAGLDLFEAYLVDAYVGALKEKIADSVRLFNPRTLLEARRTARVQEISLLWRSKKKMVLPIENGPPEKFPEPQERTIVQEGCVGKFEMGQDSFIDIESNSIFNFKTQGSVADRSSASSFSLNTEVGNVEITSGVNGSWLLDSSGGVQERNRHRGSDGGRLQGPFGQDPRFYSRQRLCLSISSKSKGGCAGNSVGNSRKVYPIPSPMGSISSSPFFTPSCGMFSPPFMGSSLEPITVSLPSMPVSLQVEQQQRVQLPKNEQMRCSQVGLYNTPSSLAPSITTTASSTLVVTILREPLNFFPSLLSLFQSLVQRTSQSGDDAQTSKNTEQLVDYTLKFTWLQKSQFEKSNLQLASTFVKLQQYFRGYTGICNTQWAYGLGLGSKEDSPMSLHRLCFTIPLGVINDGLFQKWAWFLNFTPTRI